MYRDIKKTPIFIIKITNLGKLPAKGLSCGMYLFTWELSVRSEPDYTDAEVADMETDETRIPRMSTSHSQRLQWEEISRLSVTWDTH